MLFSAALGVAYCAVVSKYQLLQESTLKIQMGAYALSVVAGCQILGTSRPEKQIFCAATPIVIIGVATFFSKETVKAKLISSAVLSASQLIMGKVCTVVEKKDPPPPPGGRGKPIVESRELGVISLEEMGDDPNKVRGFTKMVQGPWLEKQLKQVCDGKAHFVDSVVTQDNHELLDLDRLLTENTNETPTVVLVNHHKHYTLVVYEPKEKKVYRFNSKYAEDNVLETKVIQKMQGLFDLEDKDVIRNKHLSQGEDDGWSCAFQVIYFLEHFLNNSSMDDMDHAPIPQESLARRLGTYYEFLLEEQNKVPNGYEAFYETNIQEADTERLAFLLNRACVEGKKLKGADQVEQRQNFRKQIECILVRLSREENSKATMLELFRTLKGGEELFRKDRIFLADTLKEQEGSRGAIVDLFYTTYNEHYRHVLDPR